MAQNDIYLRLGLSTAEFSRRLAECTHAVGQLI